MIERTTCLWFCVSLCICCCYCYAFNPVFLFFCLFVCFFLFVVVICLFFCCFLWDISFYLGFLSRTFTIHMTAGEGGGYFFNFSLPLPPTLVMKWLWCKLHGYLISRLSIPRIVVHASIINSKSCFCIFVCLALTCLLIYQALFFFFLFF